MTDEMYQKLNRAPSPRRGKALPVALAVCAVLFAGLLVLSLWGPVYRLRFNSYMIALSRSTTASYQQGALEGEADGRAVVYSAGGAYEIYRKLSATGAGNPRMFTPRRPPELTLYYADGGVLQIWDTPPAKNSGRISNQVTLDYRSGSVHYRYDTPAWTLDQLIAALEHPEYEV